MCKTLLHVIIRPVQKSTRDEPSAKYCPLANAQQYSLGGPGRKEPLPREGTTLPALHPPHSRAQCWVIVRVSQFCTRR